jgi:PAS domain S-box-containing protein
LHTGRTVKRTYKTKAQFMRELEEMRAELAQLDRCRLEFQSAQKKYETLLESAPDAMVFVNRGGTIVLCNAQFEKLFGYSVEELIGKNLDMLVPERYRHRHGQHIEEFFSRPRTRPMGMELQIYGLKKDGSEFPADISLSPLDAEGELLVTAAIRDITERKNAEERIERNYHVQRVISAVLRVSLETVSLEEQLDRTLELIFTVPGLALESRGFIYLVGDEPDILVLKAPMELPESPRPVCDRVPFGQCLCGQAALDRVPVYADAFDARHEIRDQGDFPHGHYCIPIVSGQKALGLINVFVREGHQRTEEEENFLLAVADTLAGIIERRSADAEKERLREQLAQGEKFAALGRIAANIADELRNPLTSVGGFARLLHKKSEDGTKEKEYAGFIVTEVERLEKILRNVLALSRDTVLPAERHNLNEIIDAVLAMYEEKSPPGQIHIVKSYGRIPPLPIDKGHVREAIRNLVENGIDAMPAGGTLTVITDGVEVKGIPYLSVKISDTGSGIPEENMKMIFEPFFTTKVQPKGTGLGLPIAKKIIEDHGGFMQVDSEEGKGSAFTLFFPYTREE